jgi:hypothetical protein
MHRISHSLLLTAVTIVLLLPGCAPTSTADLKQSNGLKQVWVVDAPIATTFKAYKDLAESHMTGSDFLWAEGIRPKAYFYGDTAELTLGLEGNPFGNAKVLHLEFAKQLNTTAVTAWSFNNHWQKKAEELRHLLPTLPASAP